MLLTIVMSYGTIYKEKIMKWFREITLGASTFQQTKRQIMDLIGKREGFTDEVFTSITASYLYFEKNYPEQINETDIYDAKKFKIPSSVPEKRTLANIYLNRIINNVKSIEYTKNESRYSSGEDKVYIATDDLDKRLQHWNQSEVSEHADEIKKQIQAKVLTHELIHAASFNGLFVGFSSYAEERSGFATYAILSNKYKDKYTNINAQASRLEEAITEILALNIVGAHNLDIGQQRDGFIICRNPDSSNHNLNAFAEYFVRIYPDCIQAKLTDGWAWNNKFEKEHSKDNPYFEIKTLNDYLRALANQKIDVFNGISSFQEMLLLDYLKNLNVKNRQDLEQLVKNYAAFTLFAARGKNGKVDKDLNECLDRVKGVIKTYIKSLNVSSKEMTQLFQQERSALNLHDKSGKKFYPEPYEEIMHDDYEDDLSLIK